MAAPANVAGSGLANKKPWMNVKPSFCSVSNWLSSSTPSATVAMSSAFATSTTLLTRMRVSAFVRTWSMKDLSIFMMSIGSSESLARDE